MRMLEGTYLIHHGEWAAATATKHSQTARVTIPVGRNSSTIPGRTPVAPPLHPLVDPMGEI